MGTEDFLEALALVGTSAAILGVFLTVYGIINNRTLKSESRLTREMLSDVAKYLGQLIVNEGEKTRSVFKAG